MIDVTCKLPDHSEPTKACIRVHSHWNIHTYVEIEVNGERFVVDGRDLIEAVKNCMNTREF